MMLNMVKKKVESDMSNWMSTDMCLLVCIQWLVPENLVCMVVVVIRGRARVLIGPCLIDDQDTEVYSFYQKRPLLEFLFLNGSTPCALLLYPLPSQHTVGRQVHFRALLI